MSKKKSSDYWRDQVQKWNETNFRYLDVVVSSGEIRKQFFVRCKELGIDPYRVAIAAGVSINAFKENYVKTAEPRCTKAFNQEGLIKMLEFVGIDIKVSVLLKPYSETYVRLYKAGIIKKEDE